MSDDDKTVRMVTHLDRRAVEGKLAEVRQAAQAANLAEIAAMFTGIEGLPRVELEPKVNSALQILADKPQYKRITADLELVGINLKNLK